MDLFTETIKVIKDGLPTGDLDELGNEIKGPDLVVGWPAWFEERVSSEALDARDQQTWGYWVYTPDHAIIDEGDRVEIDGIVYRVVGRPGRQPAGFTIPGYLRFAVEKIHG